MSWSISPSKCKRKRDDQWPCLVHSCAYLIDYEEICYIHRYLRTEELEKLCKVIRDFGEDRGGGGGGGGVGGSSNKKAGGHKGGKKQDTKKKTTPNVPPGVRALLEALCDEG